MCVCVCVCACVLCHTHFNFIPRWPILISSKKCCVTPAPYILFPTITNKQVKPATLWGGSKTNTTHFRVRTFVFGKSSCKTPKLLLRWNVSQNVKLHGANGQVEKNCSQIIQFIYNYNWVCLNRILRIYHEWMRTVDMETDTNKQAVKVIHRTARSPHHLQTMDVKFHYLSFYTINRGLG